MTIKALFTAITLSFTVTNTSTDVKADVPVGELFEAIQLAKEGFELLEPIVKPVAKKAVKGIVRFTKKRKLQWDEYHTAKKAQKNNYISPARLLAEDTFTIATKLTPVDYDKTQDVVDMNRSKSVPEELAEEARNVTPTFPRRALTMPADLPELGL